MPRGRVFLLGRTRHPYHQRLWAFEVTDGEKVVFKDNCTSLSEMHDRATEGVKVLEVLFKAGHRLQHSYDDNVNQVFEKNNGIGTAR